jgi:hypothetical protein
VDGLRAVVVGSQLPLLDALEDYAATCVANHGRPDLLFAIRDSLSEATPACGGKGERGAAALVTTEKDAMNFAAPWHSELPVVCCAIEAEFCEALAFEDAILAQLRDHGGQVRA